MFWKKEKEIIKICKDCCFASKVDDNCIPTENTDLWYCTILSYYSDPIIDLVSGETIVPSRYIKIYCKNERHYLSNSQKCGYTGKLFIKRK